MLAANGQLRAWALVPADQPHRSLQRMRRRFYSSWRRFGEGTAEISCCRSSVPDKTPRPPMRRVARAHAGLVTICERAQRARPCTNEYVRLPRCVAQTLRWPLGARYGCGGRRIPASSRPCCFHASLRVLKACTPKTFQKTRFDDIFAICLPRRAEPSRSKCSNRLLVAARPRSSLQCPARGSHLPANANRGTLATFWAPAGHLH